MPRSPMDAFLDPRRRRLRAAVRKLVAESRPAEGQAGGRLGDDPGTAGQEWMASLSKLLRPGGRGTWSRLLDDCLAVDEISSVWPRVGGSVVPFLSRRVGSNPEVRSALAAAERLGASAFLLDSCVETARRRNLFESILLDYQKIQQELADLRAALEAARLETYRALLLLDEGKVESGLEELGRASARTGVLLRRILEPASNLLGEPWIAERIPDVRGRMTASIPGEANGHGSTGDFGSDERS